MTAASEVPRKRRANGEESRQKILDAAAEIAGERGYDGTSIALVSERSGLPASSIYWHFEDKDQLIAAVIERSFARWLERVRLQLPAGPRAGGEALFVASVRDTGRALLDAPDFLRLGLMLALERRPEETTARAMFLRVREQTFAQILAAYTSFFGSELDSARIRLLATLTMAAADGCFIAHELDAKVDLDACFELLATALLATTRGPAASPASSAGGGARGRRKPPSPRRRARRREND
jgi:AcrR family transcriptional regulator